MALSLSLSLFPFSWKCHHFSDNDAIWVNYWVLALLSAQYRHFEFCDMQHILAAIQ